MPPNTHHGTQIPVLPPTLPRAGGGQRGADPPPEDDNADVDVDTMNS